MTQSVFAYQAVPAAPGGAAPGASPVEPAAPNAPPPGDVGMGLPLMLLMFLPLILFMFWQTRSQQKKQEAAIAGLKKGDRVVTQSGLVGRLAEVDTRYAKVEIAPGVKATILRSSLIGRDTEDAAKREDTSKRDDAAKRDDTAKTESVEKKK